MKSRIYLLIKVFDNEKYADAFINQGEMYCRTLGDFKRIENDELRGDVYEGVTDWHQPDKIKMTISYTDKNGVEQIHELKDLAGPLIVQNSGFDSLNLFCMYALKIEEFEDSYETEEERIKVIEKINNSLKIQSTLGEEVLALGEFAVLIYNVKDFIAKVKTKAKASGYGHASGLVSYFAPDTFHGSFKGLGGVFKKRNTYSHQNEYRFVFNLPGSESAPKIHIGPLSDIAFKLPTREINSKVQLRLNESEISS